MTDDAAVGERRRGVGARDRLRFFTGGPTETVELSAGALGGVLGRERGRLNSGGADPCFDGAEGSERVRDLRQTRKALAFCRRDCRLSTGVSLDLVFCHGHQAVAPPVPRCVIRSLSVSSDRSATYSFAGSSSTSGSRAGKYFGGTRVAAEGTDASVSRWAKCHRRSSLNLSWSLSGSV